MGRFPVPDGDGIPVAGHWLLGQVRRGGMGQDGVGLVQHRLMEAVVEAHQIIIEAEEDRVLHGADRPLDGLRPLQHGVLPV